MHSALCIPEVVHEIAEYLDRRSLARLARTARVFEQPASASLYRRVGMRYLRALVERMSRASGDIAEDARLRARCVAQAKLVRWIGATSNWTMLSDGTELGWYDIQSTIALIRRPLYPFPNLTTFEVLAMEPETLTLIDSFLCPTLEALSLSMIIRDDHELPVWESRLFGLLDSLVVKSGRISRLEIVTDSAHDGWRTEFDLRLAEALGPVCRQLPLVKFYMGTISFLPQLLLNLAPIESVESILLYAYSDENTIALGTDPLQTFPDTLRGFQALKNVQFRGGGIISDVVKSLQGAELQTIFVEITEWGPHVAVLLESACSFGRTLTRLQIQASDGLAISRSHMPVHTIPSRVFAHLLDCLLIRFFRFAFPFNNVSILDPSNSDLEALAKLWTNLREFDLRYGWARSMNPPAVTVEAFIPFALYCPHLYDITIDPLDRPYHMDMPPSAIPPHPWKALQIRLPKYFKVVPKPIMRLVACYVDALWPDVLLTIAIAPSGQPGHEREIEVNDVLSGMRTGRAMHPGSRWRLQQEGRFRLVQSTTFEVFDASWDACPWEIVV